MKTRILAIAVAVLTLAMPVAARADVVDDLVSVLTEQGYSSIEVATTFLGRTRILATNAQGTRELVINPRTGEVLRDVWTTLDGQRIPPVLSSLSDDDDDRSGRVGDDDDDDDNSGHGGDDDDDDDDDDDSSGHGSGHDDDDDD